jgi:hypothetical protein
MDIIFAASCWIVFGAALVGAVLDAYEMLDERRWHREVSRLRKGA